MRKILFAVVFSLFVAVPFISLQTVSGQTQKTTNKIESKSTGDQTGGRGGRFHRAGALPAVRGRFVRDRPDHRRRRRRDQALVVLR